MDCFPLYCCLRVESSLPCSDTLDRCRMLGLKCGETSFALVVGASRWTKKQATTVSTHVKRILEPAQ